MSVAPTQFTCDRCDFTAGSTIIWGRYYYQLAKGSLVHIKRRAGWCFNCKSIVPIETLDAVEAMNNLKRLKGELNQQEQQLEDIRIKEFFYTKSIFSRWFAKDDKREKLQEAVDFLHKQVNEALLYVNILRSRKSPPRCLKCSHDNIVPFEIPSIKEGAGICPTGFIHPDCGGNIMAAMSGIRIAMKFEPRIYSAEGIRQREE